MMERGGLFKAQDVGHMLMAGALNVPVSVMESAGEGGAWDIALLAAYCAEKQEGETLEQLKKQVYKANMLLPEYRLITFTWRKRGLFL